MSNDLKDKGQLPLPVVESSTRFAPAQAINRDDSLSDPLNVGTNILKPRAVW